MQLFVQNGHAFLKHTMMNLCFHLSQHEASRELASRTVQVLCDDSVVCILEGLCFSWLIAFHLQVHHHPVIVKWIVTLQRHTMFAPERASNVPTLVSLFVPHFPTCSSVEAQSNTRSNQDQRLVQQARSFVDAMTHDFDA